MKNTQNVNRPQQAKLAKITVTTKNGLKNKTGFFLRKCGKKV